MNQSILRKIGTVFGVTIVLASSILQSILFGSGNIVAYLIPFTIPLLLLVLYFSFFNLKNLYYLIVLTIPFSIEVVLPGNYGMSLPSEPLMFGMMLLFITQLLFSNIDKSYFNHPVTFFLLLFVFWLIITTFQSTHVWVSIKFIIMKCWFILVFYLFTVYLLNASEDINKILILYIAGMGLVIIYTLLNHARYGFDFAHSSSVMSPFFRNHVNYGATIAAIYPYLLMGAFHKPFPKYWRRIIQLLLIICTVGLLFTYTRASYGAIFLLPFVYITYRAKIVSLSLSIALIAIVLFVNFFFSNYYYMNYALEGRYTEFHADDYVKQLQATAKMRDVSTMERFYRWIAAYNMIRKEPIWGFGPGTFIFEYRNYTVEAFRTSVSDNPENSGLHSQYLTYWVETGWIGMLLHLGFTVYILIFASKVYHTCKDTTLKKQAIAATLSLITIVIHNVVNDLLEVDKLASLYFIAIAIIVHVDIRNKKQVNTEHLLTSS
ncbi:MAG: O-antigen ligase family protein [Bacteroidia bacterium]|nr:O-antigen ligase family protein [Bacteroidia bacterium]MDW8346969.1 O-antigen ligase family protein [Bacteroidia bacterium]